MAGSVDEVEESAGVLGRGQVFAPQGLRALAVAPLDQLDQRRVRTQSLSMGEGDACEWAALPNRGTWVDFAAPGEDLVSTYFKYRPRKGHGPRFDGWAEWTGTSFSTAVVSGAIARTMTEHDRIRW